MTKKALWCTADSPWEVGAHMIAALDNAFILGYPFLIMAYLGWGAGSTLFILFGILSFYCNCCLARLHTYGGHRNIRFRDLAGSVFGKAQTKLMTWRVAFLNKLPQAWASRTNITPTLNTN